MSQKLTQHIPSLESMNKYPTTLFYKGDLNLLKRPKVSIVGTRWPSNYIRKVTYKFANALSKWGVCFVSGAAMGVDTIAHSGVG